MEQLLAAAPDGVQGYFYRTSACADLDPERRCVVYPGAESYPLGNDVQAIPLADLARMLAEASP